MESASIPFSEEQFLCSICLDVFTDPVTIPCGHNYCKTCITRYWDSTDVCKCPQCNRTIYKGQEFSVNTFISDVVRQYVRHKTDAELRRIRRYAVDVTLDPDTAHCKLILSEDGKRASTLGDGKKLLPYTTKRFSTCGCVLAKQSFRSTRFYYEVQVEGKTAWSLGVARESIDRKGRITLNPNNGYWTLLLRNGHEYKAAAGPAVVLPRREEEEVRKVGLFVDYEEGLVSFYDVEASVHLYSFTGCTFTEKLFPYFSPGVNDGGENSAPLIISPS